MKTLQNVCFWGIIFFLVVLIGFTFYYNPVIDGFMALKIWPVILFSFLVVVVFWANNIFRKKEQESSAEIKVLGEKLEEKNYQLKRERDDLSGFLSQQLTPEAAYRQLNKLINLLGTMWWGNYGENILSKLFFERQGNDESSFLYIKDFLKEASEEEDNYSLLSSVFSLLTLDELAQALVNFYYDYSINLINGNNVTSPNKIIFFIKHSKKLPSELFDEIEKYAKVVSCKNNDEMVAQKVLTIIECEITKVRN